MYEIKKNGKHLSYEDVIRYVKLQSNGIYCLCSDDEATGVVVNNDYYIMLKPNLKRYYLLPDLVLHQYQHKGLLGIPKYDILLAIL